MLTFTYVDKDSTQWTLSLPDPDWITDYTKIHNVVVRRSMSGKIRTYVTRDRKYAHAITYSMRFVLHRDELRRLKKFLSLSDGHYIWTHGLDSDCSAIVSAQTGSGNRIVPISGATGSINVGDYARVDGIYYSLVGLSDRTLTLGTPLQTTVTPGMIVDIIKMQMGIINNQQFDFASDGRAAGDEEDTDSPGHLVNVEDETYPVTLSVLVIKT